ncbi:hypothetical protein GCM10010174_21180 [Kutzneria viridogrisea]|uniref:Metalloprotease n=1 Tax=Kutzneria viridogrisea TaxID=47990 RepID=A0ABR6BT49_9PSEU|nr:hypothetical protein [Kutzneria viridogrisea]
MDSSEEPTPGRQADTPEPSAAPPVALAGVPEPPQAPPVAQLPAVPRTDDPLAAPNPPGWPSPPYPPTLTWAPLPRKQPRENNPFVVVGVLALVLLLVLGVGMVGTLTTEVEGVASAAPATATSTTSSAPAAPRRSLKLEDNPLLKPGKSLAASTCTLPQFGRSTAQLEAYFAAEIRCLDEAWRPVLQSVNLPFEPTRLTMDGEAGGCKAGTDTSERPTAFYCGADNRLHMPVDSVLEDTGGIPSVMIGVLAHEYGHHVQDLSGVLAAESRREFQAGRDSAAGNELSRRLELQANCFAGMFLASVAGRGSITKATATNGAASFAEGGAEQTHGSPAHQGRWAEVGYKDNNTASCNTWVAPPGDVS